MLTPKTSKQFRKDLKKSQKQGKDLSKLKRIMKKLAKNDPLAAKYRDHPLGGKYRGYRDCHVEPDWVLIYRINYPVIWFERIGTHSELFKS